MRYIIFIFIVLMFFQCGKVAEVTDEMVNEKLNLIREDFRKAKIAECEKMLMEEIEASADSILIYFAKKIKYDSLTIPYDSIKPIKPEVQFPKYKKPRKPVEVLVDSSKLLKQDSLKLMRQDSTK